MVFDAMPIHDQRHALDVVARLRAGDLTDGDLLAAALLHDAGKGARVRLWHRVVAVLVDAVSPNGMEASGSTDPTSWRYPFHVQHHHEALSAQVALDAGRTAVAAFIVGAWRSRMRGWRLHCGPRTRHPERMDGTDR